MAGARSKWQLVTALTAAGCLAIAAAGFAQFTSFNDRTRAMLEGNWQSCREADGQYSERVFDARVPGLGPFELHMGPYHEFALFKGIQETHRDHSSPENLLHPYNVAATGVTARQSWAVAGLSLDVALAGGSREECESWFITFKRAPNPSSSN